jgi:hypothetical protein
MRKQQTAKTKSPRRFRRFALAAIAIAVFSLAATAAIRMQTQAKESPIPSSRALSSNRNYANLRSLAAQQNSDGQIRPLTQEEAQRLAEGIRELIKNSAEGLTAVKQADGSVRMDLQGHYQNVILAKKTNEGVAEACVDNPEAAAAFLGIDPNLIKSSTAASTKGAGK